MAALVCFPSKPTKCRPAGRVCFLEDNGAMRMAQMVAERNGGGRARGWRRGAAEIELLLRDEACMPHVQPMSGKGAHPARCIATSPVTAQRIRSSIHCQPILWQHRSFCQRNT